MQVPAPGGGGNYDINVIRDGVKPDITIGENVGDSLLQYDTCCNYQDADGADWYGYEFTCPVPFESLVFQEGLVVE